MQILIRGVQAFITWQRYIALHYIGTCLLCLGYFLSIRECSSRTQAFITQRRPCLILKTIVHATLYQHQYRSDTIRTSCTSHLYQSHFQRERQYFLLARSLIRGCSWNLSYSQILIQPHSVCILTPCNFNCVVCLIFEFVCLSRDLLALCDLLKSCSECCGTCSDLFFDETKLQSAMFNFKPDLNISFHGRFASNGILYSNPPFLRSQTEQIL